MKEVRIIGVGKYLPGTPVDNAEALAACTNVPSGINQKWMEEKIGSHVPLSLHSLPAGIRTRHTARDLADRSGEGRPLPGECNSDMGCKSAQEALKCAGVPLEEVELLIVSTCTPDYPVPSTASLVQDKLGLPQCCAIDIRAACCGSVQAIVTAMQFLQTGLWCCWHC